MLFHELWAVQRPCATEHKAAFCPRQTAKNGIISKIVEKIVIFLHLQLAPFVLIKAKESGGRLEWFFG
jgi:hypothetical protein